MKPNRKDWDAFTIAARPIVAAMCDGYAPSTKTLRDLGLGWITSAANNHYGGMRRVLRRWGLPKMKKTMPPSPRRIARLPKVSSKRYRHWTRRDVQVATLREMYADELAWGTMPSSSRMERECSGLAVYWLHTPDGWLTPQREFALLSPAEGKRQKEMYLAIDEALTFFESKGRWPKQMECSWKLKNRRYTGWRDWETFVKQDEFHPRILERLIERWRRHEDWLRTSGDFDRARSVRGHLNVLDGLRSRAEPFGRRI